MSELTSKNTVSQSRRRHFLATVSTLAIVGMGISNADAAEAADRPTVWLEIGGQLEHLGKQSDAFVPAFAEFGIQQGLISPAVVQNPSSYSLGEQGSIIFRPAGSGLSFSASIRYGRTSTNKHRHQEVSVTPIYIPGYSPILPFGPNGSAIPRTADYMAKSRESHAILDFRAGKDVGLGMMSATATSHFDVGVRFAQFTSRSQLNLSADPDPHRGYKYFSTLHRSLPFTNYFQFYRGKPDIERSFTGIGPSLTWSGSLPVLGSADGDASVALDIGANFAVLFGRQKVAIHHHTTADLISQNLKYHRSTYSNYNNTARTKSVVVPNIGGFAGVSLNFPNAKVALGYRADFFLGAMDGGIDSRKTYDRNFYGPFASISIGLGG